MTTRTPKKRAPRAPAPIATTRLQRFEADLLAHLSAVGTWLVSHMRHRTLLVWLVPALVLAALWFTDPDGGASTKAWAIRVLVAVVVVALAHWGRKAMLDYPEADVRTLFAKAREEPTGAGLALIAVAIVLLGLLMAFAGQAHGETLELQRARAYLPMLEREVDRTWAAHPDRTILAGQISNETACPRQRSCWLPSAELRSAREQGVGFGQFTRTFRADGSTRFDALTEIVQRHPALNGLSWNTITSRPDLQLRAFVLKALDDNRTFVAVTDPHERMLFGLVSHNRGAGGVQNERMACKLAPGCDPGRWFGNVELHCTASRVALYGNRSACDISRAYPKDIIQRAQRYRGLV
jgi:membrane-bound metal-dependent hydrolase YbcI (DUF457 family)